MTRREIIVTDWTENKKFLFSNALVTMAAMVGVAWLKPEGIDAKLILLLSAMASAPFIAYCCFGVVHESQRIKELLGPITRDQLIVTKFVSAFSMTLFAVNIPGVMLLDPKWLLDLNAAVLLLTALCVAAMVVSLEFDAWPVILLVVTLTSLPAAWFQTLMDYVRECLHWISAHSTACAIVALCAIPVIVVWSTLHREPHRVKPFPGEGAAGEGLIWIPQISSSSPDGIGPHLQKVL